MRCLPQDEDTGGFFVAAFRKIRTTDSAKSVAEMKLEDDPTDYVEADASIAMLDAVEEFTEQLESSEDTSSAAIIEHAASTAESVSPATSDHKKKGISTRDSAERAGSSRAERKKTKGLTEFHPWNKDDFDKV